MLKHCKSLITRCRAVIRLLAVACITTCSTAASESPLLLVAGYGSDNVVQFDPATGNWTQLIRLEESSRPRGITVGDSGEVYLGTHGRGKNIIRYSPTDGYTEPTDITRSIGRYGAGIISYLNGHIYAAGDTERAILRIDSIDGAVTTISQSNCCNLVGVMIAGDRILAAEYFQRSILRFDMAEEKPKGVRLVDKSPHLNRPVGMTIGHNGNLFVSNGLEPTVVEFDIETGDYVRTLINLGSAAPEGIYGIASHQGSIGSTSPLVVTFTKLTSTASYWPPTTAPRSFKHTASPLCPLRCEASLHISMLNLLPHIPDAPSTRSVS